jgi:hypothetical protein
MTFYWNGLGGQPKWLWGSSDGTSHYVYNPANFSVNYANTSGTSNNSNAVGGLSNAYFMQRLVDTWNTDNVGNQRLYFANGGTTHIKGYTDVIVAFQNGNPAIASRIRAGGTYESLSDRRTKYDIVDADDIGRDQLMALRPRWYKRYGIDKLELGWISQEVREALPIAVQPINPDDPDELLYIDEKAISVATVATVKQLVVEPEALKAEVAALKADAAQKSA